MRDAQRVMENPDVELAVERAEKGLITRMAYKVYTRSDGGKPALEFCSVVSETLRPADTNVNTDADISIRGE